MPGPTVPSVQVIERLFGLIDILAAAESSLSLKDISAERVVVGGRTVYEKTNQDSP